LGRKILTNAHVVADHTFVLVRKHGCHTKYRAEVKAVGHECDLAILTIENEEFWDGMNPLELGDVPFLQEAVAVVGYPQGSNSVWINLCYIFCVLFFLVFEVQNYILLRMKIESITKERKDIIMNNNKYEYNIKPQEMCKNIQPYLIIS